MAYICKEFDCLPSAGGLLDQDAYHVWLMSTVAEAQAERRELEYKKQKNKQH